MASQASPSFSSSLPHALQCNIDVQTVPPAVVAPAVVAAAANNSSGDVNILEIVARPRPPLFLEQPHHYVIGAMMHGHAWFGGR
jgi:hypothetical protein